MNSDGSIVVFTLRCGTCKMPIEIVLRGFDQPVTHKHQWPLTTGEHEIVVERIEHTITREQLQRLPDKHPNGQRNY